MTIIELIFISIGLGMDACSVAICKGLCMQKMSWYKAFVIALYFATFQFIMPLIGYYFGGCLGEEIKVYNHIIACVLLLLLGFNMIKEAFTSDDSNIDDSISFKRMIIPSIATSIDALTIGMTFSLLDINIFSSGIIIFVITFILSIIGTRIGQLFGEKYKRRAQILGGIILLVLGIHMLF